VSGAPSTWYWLGSVTSASTLTSTSSGAYTQPFGSDGGVDAETFGDDACKLVRATVGWRNRSGILVVFEGIEEATCQRCGLRTIEVNPRHAVGLNGGPHWDSRGEVKGCVRDDRGVAVTDLQGPPSERTPEQKLRDFKTRAQQYARDRESCDDVRISYLEFLETEAEDDLALARMIAG
jgi:hypothetical protein